jgi:hypothetical protein
MFFFSEKTAFYIALTAGFVASFGLVNLLYAYNSYERIGKVLGFAGVWIYGRHLCLEFDAYDLLRQWCDWAYEGADEAGEKLPAESQTKMKWIAVATLGCILTRHIRYITN